MDKNDILDYVIETPGNTNRAVLGSMLDSMGNSKEDNIVIMKVESIMDAQTQTVTVTACDKTAQEVFDLMSAGKVVVASIYVDVQVNDSTVQENYITIMLYQYDATHHSYGGYAYVINDSSSNYIQVFHLYSSAGADLPSISTFSKTL